MAEQDRVVTEERFYYADGEKVPLMPSRQFVAVRGADGGGAAARAASTMADSLSTLSAPIQVLELPEYDLAVIAVADGMAASAARAVPAESLRAMVASQPDVTLGPPVYETETSPAREGLIPVGEVLVKFKPETAEDARRKLLDRNGLEVRRADYPEPGAYLAAAKHGQDVIDAANALHESEAVEFAEPNFVHVTPRLAAMENGGVAVAPSETPPRMVRPMERPADEAGAAEGPAAPPNDPGYASQWNLRKIKAPEAWDISMGSPAISVAILDEGCDMTHEDIAYKLPGYDAYQGDDNPQPDGNDAHGTACGGVAAMKAGNAKGGVGVAPGCKVMPIRIAKGVGGGFWDTTSAKVADAIRKAVDAPRSADVLSNSYGLSPSTAVTNAFKYAQTNGRAGKGCPIAAAAGNANTPPVLYPARLSPTIPGFLAVSASNEWDQRKSKTSLDGETWWGSSFGPEVDVAAPGVHIYSPDISGGAGYGPGNYVPNFNGTSSATPHVAGLMALILSVDPALRSWEVEDIIKLTADDLGPGGRDPEFGFGRINCRHALEAASRFWYQIAITPVFLGVGKECYLRVNLRMYNPGINTVRLDALTLTSHNTNWTAEIDRFEYRPNPGNVLAPRSGSDVRFNQLLLRANGNQSSWNYRWAIGWSYTFWRPAAPGFPLAAGEPLVESEGMKVTVESKRGEGDKAGSTSDLPGLDGFTFSAGSQAPTAQAAGGGVPGDSITIDRQSKEITIVIR